MEIEVLRLYRKLKGQMAPLLVKDRKRGTGGQDQRRRGETNERKKGDSKDRRWNHQGRPWRKKGEKRNGTRECNGASYALLLGRCLLAVLERAILAASDWNLGVVYLKSARRSKNHGPTRRHPTPRSSTRLIGYWAWYNSNLQGVFSDMVRHRHEDGASHVCRSSKRGSRRLS